MCDMTFYSSKGAAAPAQINKQETYGVNIEVRSPDPNKKTSTWKVTMSLPRRSIYIMTGPSRYDWKHQVSNATKLSLNIDRLSGNFFVGTFRLIQV